MNWLPNSGHLVHMPGHANFYNGLYAQSSQSFEESSLVDSAYNSTRDYALSTNWNYAHNMHFLMLALAEQGRLKDADEWGKELQSLLGVEAERDMSTGYANSQLARVQMYWRLERWEKCIELSEQISDEITAYADHVKYYFDGLKIYFEVMQAVHLNEAESAYSAQKRLRKHISNSKAYSKEVEKELRQMYFPLSKGLLLVCEIYAEWSVLGLEKSIEGWDHEKDLSLIKEYDEGDPSLFGLMWQEALGNAYEKAQVYDKAIKWYEQALAWRPNSGPILLHLARLYFKTSQTDKSRSYLTRFEEAWSSADEGLIEFEMARVLDLDLQRIEK